MTEQHTRKSDPWAGAWDRCTNDNCECRADDAITIPLTDKEDVE